MTFNENHMWDTLYTESHVFVVKVTKCCVLNHMYMSPRLLKNMHLLSSALGWYLELRHHIQFTQTCPGDSTRTMCATLACLESFSVGYAYYSACRSWGYPATPSYGDDSRLRRSRGCAKHSKKCNAVFWNTLKCHLVTLATDIYELAHSISDMWF